MSEPITFWMDNKNCVGMTAAIIGNETLVSYRDRYYVLLGGVAQNKGGKALRYSQTSLPPIWKRALKGDVQLPETLPTDFDSGPILKPVKRERKKREKPAMTENKNKSQHLRKSIKSQPRR